MEMTSSEILSGFKRLLARSRSHGGMFPSHPDDLSFLYSNLPSLVVTAEQGLKVVEAAREVPIAAAWLMNSITEEPVHADVVAVFERLSAALAAFQIPPTLSSSAPGEPALTL